MSDDFEYLKNDFIILWKFLTKGKKVSYKFGKILSWLQAREKSKTSLPKIR